MSGLLDGPYGNGCWEQARFSLTREREREKGRKRKSAKKIAASLVLRPLSRSLAPTGISPTTFRHRDCTPRFGEDLVINHDAAISQSNVRSLAAGEGGRTTRTV